MKSSVVNSERFLHQTNLVLTFIASKYLVLNLSVIYVSICQQSDIDENLFPIRDLLYFLTLDFTYLESIYFLTSDLDILTPF